MKSKIIRGYLIAGLVVWLPIIATIFVLSFIIDVLDKTVNLLPNAYHPEQLLGFNVPGLGVVLSLLILFFTGILVTNFLGQKLVAWGEMLLAKIPLVRSIYNAVKQVMQTVLSSNSQAFRKVLLVEYPRKGLWSIAFQTSVAENGLHEHLSDEMITIFIPTTPNPTSGFLIMVPAADVKELDMSIDEALKLVISLGVVHPANINKELTDKV